MSTKTVVIGARTVYLFFASRMPVRLDGEDSVVVMVVVKGEEEEEGGFLVPGYVRAMRIGRAV